MKRVYDVIIVCHSPVRSLSSSHSKGHSVVDSRFLQYHSVIVVAFLPRYQLQRTLFAVLAKGIPDSFGEVELFAKEQLGKLVKTVTLCDPFEYEHSLFKSL